jgi:hypothetical protein
LPSSLVGQGITTPTSELSVFRGPVTNAHGKRLGSLQGYCVAINDRSGRGECTTTFFLSGSQIALTGPTWNRSVRSSFRQAVTGGTGHYKNVRGEAIVTLKRNKNVVYSIQLIP